MGKAVRKGPGCGQALRPWSQGHPGGPGGGDSKFRTAYAEMRTGRPHLGWGVSWDPGLPAPNTPRSTLGRGRTDPPQREAGWACCPVPRGAEASEAPTWAPRHHGLPAPLRAGRLRQGGGQQRTWGWGSGPQATAPLRPGRGRGPHRETQARPVWPSAGRAALWAVCTSCGAWHVRVPGRVCLWRGWGRVLMHMRVVSVHVCKCASWKGRRGPWRGPGTGRGWAGHRAVPGGRAPSHRLLLLSTTRLRRLAFLHGVRALCCAPVHVPHWGGGSGLLCRGECSVGTVQVCVCGARILPPAIPLPQERPPSL